MFVAESPFLRQDLVHRLCRRRTVSNASHGRASDKAGRIRLFLLHIIRSMKGTARCVHFAARRPVFAAMPKRSFAGLVLSGSLKGHGLPANLCFGTGYRPALWVLDKENATARKGIFMIDASKGFIERRAEEPAPRADISPHR